MDSLFDTDSGSFPECRTILMDSPDLLGILVQKGQELGRENMVKGTW
jgi:hypothetical protein